MAKTFVVTGAGRGVGRGVSRLLLQAGHRVFLLDKDEAELAHTAGTLAQTHWRGRDFEAAPCDVRRVGDVAEAARRAGALFAGRLDCLVNNAAYTRGAGGGAGLADMTLDEWKRSVETNLTGPMLMTQACLAMLRAARGCVVHMSSTRAFMSEANNEAYSATKARLVGLAQSMAVSLAGDGVRVSAVLPGWIHVGDESKAADEAGTAWEEGLSEADMRWQLTGRVGRVEDIFKAVVYLAENDGVTGAELVVDGGGDEEDGVPRVRACCRDGSSVRMYEGEALRAECPVVGLRGSLSRLTRQKQRSFETVKLQTGWRC